jgi:hypothetical protein
MSEQTKLTAPATSPEAAGSAEKRGYARGYAAAIKRLKLLEDEIARLNELKTPLPPLPLPDSHDVTIEYLITSAETLAGAANMLIGMRRCRTCQGTGEWCPGENAPPCPDCGMKAPPNAELSHAGPDGVNCKPKRDPGVALQ